MPKLVVIIIAIHANLCICVRTEIIIKKKSVDHYRPGAHSNLTTVRVCYIALTVALIYVIGGLQVNALIHQYRFAV